jgi:predicted PurR-regulated permease PerM
MSKTSTDAVEWSLPRGLIVLLSAASAVLVVAGTRAASEIIGPIFLAIVLTIAISPVGRYLRRHGWPPWASTLVSILSTYVVLVVIVVAVGYALARFAALLPRYQEDMAALVKSATAGLSRIGLDPAQIDALNGSLDPDKLVSAILALLSGLLAALSNLVLLVLLLLFLGIDAAHFPGKLAARRADRAPVVTAVESFVQGTRRYLVVATVFGFIVAVLDTGFLRFFTPIPDPLLWGILAFITNYIPNVGFVVGLVPPAVLGLLEGGPGLMLLVIVVYSVLNAIIQSVIQPRVVGEVVGLSGTVTFVSLVFWAWVLGAVGALFAVPLTLLAKALLVDIDPRAAWLSPLLAGGPEVPTTADDLAEGQDGAPGEPDRVDGRNGTEVEGRHAPLPLEEGTG